MEAIDPTFAEPWVMRLISLIAAASLALAGSGCTLIGATAGAVTTPTHSTSSDTGALVGAMIGLAIDVATIVAVKHSLDQPYINTCPTCD